MVFELEEYVYLKQQPYKHKSLKKKFNVKLSQRYYGPFKVLECIGEVAYKLELPPSSLLCISTEKEGRRSKCSFGRSFNFYDEGEIVLKPGEAL